MKRVLIPIWVIQLIVLLVFAAAAGLALYAVGSVDLGNAVENVLKYVLVRAKIKPQS